MEKIFGFLMRIFGGLFVKKPKEAAFVYGDMYANPLFVGVFSDKIDALLKQQIVLYRFLGNPVPPQSVLIIANKEWSYKEIPGITILSEMTSNSGASYGATATEEAIKVMDADPNVRSVEWGDQLMAD